MEILPNSPQTANRKWYRRIPYGQETNPWDTRIPCHDCGAVVGQLHHRGCDAEECARCGGQAISCGCWEEVRNPLVEAIRMKARARRQQIDDKMTVD